MLDPKSLGVGWICLVPGPFQGVCLVPSPFWGGDGRMCMTDTTPGRYTPRKVPLPGEGTPPILTSSDGILLECILVLVKIVVFYSISSFVQITEIYYLCN